MYSPFRNEQGQPKELDEVTYADLAQLKELEEGFALEFKRTWNENVRVKVPKIIASFANSHGGWLIIGIADDDKAVAFVHTEDVADLCAQFENVVAVALLAKFAEAAQVLTNLRGGDAHALAEQA